MWGVAFTFSGQDWENDSSRGQLTGPLTNMLDITSSRMESSLVMPTRVHNRVRELRLERGWTQQQLAEAVGVSRQSVNSIECRRYEPSLELALALARVFARPTDEIFSLEGPR